jgi:hypothetical protein
VLVRQIASSRVGSIHPSSRQRTGTTLANRSEERLEPVRLFSSHGRTPTLSAEEAYARAYEEDKPEGAPSSAHEVFALFMWNKDYVGLPVWVVVYEGECVPIGGTSVKPTCRGESYNTVVDSKSGDFVTSFVDTSVDL